jgi:hypothetical protein
MMWAYWLLCGWRLRKGYCEHGYELTGSINGWEYRDKIVLAGILYTSDSEEPVAAIFRTRSVKTQVDFY